MRLALVGYGRIAPKHLEVYRALGCDIVACCDSSKAARKRAAEEAGIPRTYAAIPEMIEREKPDGIVCCVSFDQTYNAGKVTFPLGVPTLLEKPPGTSVTETLELTRLAERHRTPVMVGLNRRHYSVLRRAIEDAGGSEKITAVSVGWSEDVRAFLDRGFTIGQVSKMVFGNSLHGLNLLTFLAGAVPEPHVAVSSLGDPCRWMMSLHGVSERGALATFNSTWDSPGPWSVTFCRPGRRYAFAPLETCVVSEAGTRATRTIEPDACDRQFKPGFHRQGRTFLEVIKTRQVPEQYTLASTIPSMKLAEKLTDACMNA